MIDYFVFCLRHFRFLLSARYGMSQKFGTPNITNRKSLDGNPQPSHGILGMGTTQYT